MAGGTGSRWAGDGGSSGWHRLVHVTPLCPTHGHPMNVNKGGLLLLWEQRYRTCEDFWVSSLKFSVTSTRLQPRTHLHPGTDHFLLLPSRPRDRVANAGHSASPTPTRGIIYVSAGVCLPPLSRLAALYAFFKTRCWEMPGVPSLVLEGAVLEPWPRFTGASVRLSHSPGLLRANTPTFAVAPPLRSIVVGPQEWLKNK